MTATLLLLCAFGAFADSSVGAPALQLSQYSHFAWRLRDGYFAGSPNAITQTPDGYLWIGTDDGLERFDGISFAPWALGQPGSKRLFGIQNLVPEPDGSLWIGTLTGLARLQGGKVSFLITKRVNGVVRQPDGTIWIAKSGNQDGKGFCSIAAKSGAMQCFGGGVGKSCAIGQSVSLDNAGQVWIGCNSFVLRITKASTAVLSPLPLTTELIEGTDHAPMDTLDLGGGRTLVAFAEKGPHFGLQELTAGKWLSFNPAGLIGQDLQVTRLLHDRDGGIWIGTTGNGLYHVVNGKADHFGSTDGLSGDDVASIYEDREGSVWVATQAGIDRFRRPKIVSLSPKQGMLSNYAQGVAVGPDGTVAVSLTGGLNFIRNGQITSMSTGKGLPGYLVVGLMFDHTGTLWASTDKGAGRFLGDKWIPLDAPELDRAQIVEDPQHEIIVKSHTQVLRVEGNKVLALFSALPRSASSLVRDPHEGFWVLGQHGFVMRYQGGMATVLAADRPGFQLEYGLAQPDGSVWGWGLNGLLYFKEHEWRTLDEGHGLPCNATYNVLDNGAGLIWVYGRCGVMALNKSDLDAWVADPTKRIRPQLLIDSTDGSSGGFGEFIPNSAQSSDGLLWFTSGGPLQFIDPKFALPNQTIPPVHIQQIVADRRTLPWSDFFKLPAHTREVEIDYASLSLASPQKVRFRYRLSGVDMDWQDVGNRHQAFYMNLRPGHYRFQVVGSNNDGVWNAVGDKIEFAIAPAYYQTIWFRILLLLVFAGALWSLYVLRVRIMAAKLESRLLERFSERDRIARELHDTLLQGFQAVVWSFQSSVNKMPPDDPRRKPLGGAIEKAEGVLAIGRDRVRGIRSKSAQQLPLANEVVHFAEELGQSSAKSVVVTIEGEPRSMNELVHDEVIAIIKEALTNSAKHGEAEQISCQIKFEKTRLVVICGDDGVGIPGSALSGKGKDGHFGLLGMRERAGLIGAALEFKKNEPRGTVVRLSIRAKVAYR
ncbi:sensor histidine kinase [Terriglobus sp. ADX1]|uniref:sensor histidine kinase n=1 Tax=Terriglobus sp. ADX1 TaxID=2794063 RepID=UPI002FE6A0BA